MPIHESLFLFGAALLAGALNAVAGGGGFIAFPALIFVGAPPIQATATYTAAVVPGGVASIGAYRKTYADSNHIRTLMLSVLAVGILGGIAGATLLLHTPAPIFMKLVPWLLLLATILFALSPRVVPFVRERTSRSQHNQRMMQIVTLVLELAIAMYIGFFGAGAGIMVLAMLALLGIENIHTMNGLKVILVVAVNAVALITYTVGHAVLWTYAVVMMVGSVIGGYGGAWLAQKFKPIYVRYFVICVGLTMSAYFFVR